MLTSRGFGEIMINTKFIKGTQGAVKEWDRFAYFYDKDKNKITARIRSSQEEPITALSRKMVSVACVNPDGDLVSFMKLYTNPQRKRIVLDIVYVYKKYRHLGIGAKMLELLPSVIDTSGNMVLGAYLPANYAEDCASGAEFLKEDEMRTAKFYNDFGFKIVGSLALPGAKKKLGLTESDFVFGSTTVKRVVVLTKPINENYFLSGRKLYHKNDFNALSAQTGAEDESV